MDKLRFLLKDDCSRMGILFSFSTSMIKTLINFRMLKFEINGRKIEGAADYLVNLCLDL